MFELKLIRLGSMEEESARATSQLEKPHLNMVPFLLFSWVYSFRHIVFGVIWCIYLYFISH